MSKSSRARPRKDSGGSLGYSLLEVVITLGVMSILLAAISALFRTTIYGERALDQNLAMVQLARRLEAGLSFGPASVAAQGEESGFRWRIDAVPFFADNQDKLPTPLKYKIEVRGPRGETFSVETIRLRREGSN
jgi:prepilin-type N-terminal cleavage/methylation domain-containing protein